MFNSFHSQVNQLRLQSLTCTSFDWGLARQEVKSATARKSVGLSYRVVIQDSETEMIYADAFHFCDSAPLTLTESFTKRILSGQLGPR